MSDQNSSGSHTTPPRAQHRWTDGIRNVPLVRKSDPNTGVSSKYLGGVNDVGSIRYTKQTSVKPTLQPVFQRQKYVHNNIIPKPRTPVKNIHHQVSQPPRLKIQHPQPFAKPAIIRAQPSSVLNRSIVQPPRPRVSTKHKKRVRLNKTQIGLSVLAVFVLAAGVAINVQTIKTNHAATVQVAALEKKANSATNAGDPSVPSTTKPSAETVRQYVVAPDLPRYLKIPKLDVFARVLQVGITSSGALGTPSNVYDAAWYTGSAKPGQPGATVIDGHISSWSSHGVFYGLKNLVPGDSVQIVRGDNSVVDYQVVKTVIYKASDVDMQAAIAPAVHGTPGLNLISCTGDVLKGTSQFSERIVVFTKQVE